MPRVVFTDPQAASVGAAEARFSATAALSSVAKTATYTRAYAESNGFLTLLSDGERLTGAYALGPEAGEWLQQATLAIRARVPLDVLRDTIQPFPTFSEIYVDALKALRAEIAAASRAGRGRAQWTARTWRSSAEGRSRHGNALRHRARRDASRTTSCPTTGARRASSASCRATTP